MMERIERGNQNGPGSSFAFNGARVAITGSLNNLTNNEARSAVELEGGEAVVEITARTTYLLVGENPGEELLRQAQNYQVERIDEDRFIDLLRGTFS